MHHYPHSRHGYRKEERCSGKESGMGTQHILLEVFSQALNPGVITMFRLFPFCMLTLWVDVLERERVRDSRALISYDSFVWV